MSIRSFLLIAMLLPFVGRAQFVVHGRVVDEKSLEPLAFVHVLAEGSRQGATTDIDGKFSLQVPSEEARLKFSYVGYAPLELSMRADQFQLVRMMRTAVELSTVEILPGENPAHRIIKRVYAERKKNNGLRERSHRYSSYSKTIFTAELDSTLLNDPERLAALDSNDRDALDWMEKHHLLLIESATKRSFIPPANEKEEVLGMRVSGLKDPSLLGLAASTRTFSIYEPQITLLEKNYLSPIAAGSTDRYLYILEDTLYQGADTVFVISYRPRKNKKFDALKGVLYVNTDGHALQSVIAEPAERQGGMSIKLQQQFEKVGGTAWFPVQLNTFLYLDFVQVNNWRLMGIGRTYLSDIQIDVDVERKEVRGPEFVMDRMAIRKDDDLWARLRPDTLDARELRTYHVMDSIGEKHKLDNKLKLLSALSTARLPIGPVDLRLDQILKYNGYEGIRLGAGMATNDRISRYFSLGGYFAYGFQDKEWKRGGDLTIKPRPGREFQLKMFYQDDVLESGGVSFPGSSRPLLSNEGQRMWFVERMDRIERYGAEVAFRVNSALKMWLGTEHTTWDNRLGYLYRETLTEDVVFGRSRFVTGAMTASFRLALRERVMRTPERQVTVPGKWPVLQVNAFRSVKGLWQGEEDLWRLSAMLEKVFRSSIHGELSVRILGGMAQADAAYPFLFVPQGTFDRSIPYTVKNTFEAMLPYEFLADRYVAVHIRHNFKNLLFKTRNFRPVPMLVGSAVWGELQQPAAHDGLSFDLLGSGYYEAGLQVDNILKLGTTSLGAGAFMRLGEHQFPEPIENFSFKLSLGLPY